MQVEPRYGIHPTWPMNAMVFVMFVLSNYELWVSHNYGRTHFMEWLDKVVKIFVVDPHFAPKVVLHGNGEPYEKNEVKRRVVAQAAATDPSIRSRARRFSTITSCIS